MTTIELMQSALLVTCFVTACAISFRIGTVWEQHNTRKAVHRAKVYRALADERIEEAERDIAQIKAEREVMRSVAAEWNRILEKVNGHHINGQGGGTGTGSEVRTSAAANPGLYVRH